MEQFLAFHIDYGLRSGFMGENLLYYTEQMPDSKFIVLAHKWHIAAIPESKNLGNKLRKNMGKAYYAFCFESNRGSFLSRTWNADQLYLDEFKIIELPLTEGKNLPWYLTKAKKGNFFLDLRNPESSLTIKEWIETPQDMHTPGWITKNIADNKFLYPLSLNIFDGVIFFEQTTASHPTKNALKLVPKKEGL